MGLRMAVLRVDEVGGRVGGTVARVGLVYGRGRGSRALLAEGEEGRSRGETGRLSRWAGEVTPSLMLLTLGMSSAVVGVEPWLTRGGRELRVERELGSRLLSLLLGGGPGVCERRLRWVWVWPQSLSLVRWLVESGHPSRGWPSGDERGGEGR